MELIPDVQVFCFVWLEILRVRLIFTFAALHRIMTKGSSFQFRRQTNTIGYYKVESKYFFIILQVYDTCHCVESHV